MNRIIPAMALIAVSLVAASSARAQMGMDMFQKPSLTKVMNPVVGNGAEYETTNTDSKQKPHTMEMYIVGKESLDGREAYWMEIVSVDEKGKSFLGKTLFTKDDFQFHKMVMQMPGQPAMEMPFNPGDSRKGNIQNDLNAWRSLGTETITVPAGTFSCEHWKDEKNNSEVWTSEKVTPFGMVKEVSPHRLMVLTKLLTDMQDKITGPVVKFDPQMMMQQQRPQPKP